MEDLVDARTAQRVRAITARVYSDVCTRIGYSNEWLYVQVSEEHMTTEEMIEKREALSVVYMQSIIKLATSTLEDIIKLHKSGQLKRKQETLDAIMNELLERELYGKET